MIIVKLNSGDDSGVLPFNSACTETPKKEVEVKF